MTPESVTPSDEVLPQSRLGLMKAERRSLAHRRSEVFWIETLIVKGVTDFVQECKNATRYVVGKETKCNAHIARTDHCAERMVTEVQSPVRQVEPHLLCDRFGKLALPVDGKFSRKRGS